MSKTWSTDTIEWLTQEELRELLGAITDRRDRAIFFIAYRHGLRASEIGILQLDDIDLSAYRIRIRRLKKSLSGVHPLQPDEVKVIRAWLRARKPNAPPVLFPSRRREAISRRQLDYLMKRYGAAAGIPPPKRHFHVLKHTIATHLLDAGADLHFVQDWIGHASIRNTAIYAHLSRRRRGEEARRVFVSSCIVRT